MKVLKCLIVDDEPPAIRLLEKYVSKFGTCFTISTSSLKPFQK
jgi:CheY-like chemotaxis protein